MSEQEKLELGITLVGALKANAYNCTLEDGILMALEGTELDRLPQEEIDIVKSNGKGIKTIKAVVERERKFLHKQALTLAEAAIYKINEINSKNGQTPH